MTPKFLIPALIAVLASATSPQTEHTIGRDEVRVRSAPYVAGMKLYSETQLVEVNVVVRDPHGRPIPNLTREDFEILDEGKRQELKAFSVDTYERPVVRTTAPDVSAGHPQKAGNSLARAEAAPIRSIVLFFDDVHSLPGDFGHAKFAAQRFVREVLAPGDRVSIFSVYSGEVLGFTVDRDATVAAISKLEPHPLTSLSVSCPRILPYQAYRILQRDRPALTAAVEEASQCISCEGFGCPGIEREVTAQAEEVWEHARGVAQMSLDAMRKAVAEVGQQPGKRMILLASPGFLAASLEKEEDDLVRDALRAGIVLNTLDSKGLYAEPPGRALSDPSSLNPQPLETQVYDIRSLGERLDSEDSVLARLAEGTGGLFFRNNNDFNFGFHELGAVPEIAYRLAFVPAEDEKYHRITIKLANQGHDTIQARPGYFAPSRGPSSEAANIDHLVLGVDRVDKVPMQVHVSVAPAANSNSTVSVGMRVAIAKLPFEKRNDRRVEKLIFVAAMFDAAGNFVDGKESAMELALLPETFARFSRTGIEGVMSLEAKPGAYRLRAVVLEAARGEAAASTQTVDVR